MKIAIIGHKRIPSREGGVEIVVEELSTRMVRKGHEVYVYNRRGHHVSGAENDTNDSKSCKYEGIHIISIPTSKKKSLNAIIYSFLATLHSLFGRYDVIHYHAEGPCAMLWIPALFRIRTVATIHGLDWQRSKWGGFATWYLKFGEKVAVKYADELIVLSKNVQQYFMETYGRSTNYIPNGVSRQELVAPNIITEKYNLLGNDYILFLARIVPEKGLHYLIQAFKEIDTDLKLVIAGGSSHSEDYFIKMKKIASEDKRIQMIGFVQGLELEELFSNCRMYVLPSDIEGMPLSLLEAMSYGSSCLVSNISENIEVVGSMGASFEKGNIQDIKEKLQKLINRKELSNLEKKEIQNFVCERFDWDIVTAETLMLYKKGK